MQKIIFINRFFYPDQSATSQILSDLVFNIKNDVNAEIHIVTSRNTYQNNKRLLPVENINGINVHRVWTSYFGRANLFGRAIDYVSFYIATFLMLLKLVSREDIVIAKTDPPVISYIAFLVCKFKKARLINWLQDLFPEVAGKLHFIKDNGLLYKLVKKIKDKTLLSARMNVVIGEKMGDRVKAIGVLDENVAVIPNWNINKNINYVEKEDNPFVKEWGVEGKFVVGYSGNFGRAHEYEAIRNLVSRYSQQGTVVFVFIGGGKYFDELKLYVEKENIRNVFFKPYQPADKLNQSLSVADLHLISLRPELEGLIVPSKFFGLASIGAGVLFIGDCDGELGQIIYKNKCGYCCNPQQLDEQMSQIILEGSNPNLDKYKQRLKSLYLKRYLPDNAYSSWRSLLEGVKE